MGKLVKDINRLGIDVQHVYNDVLHIEKDIYSLGIENDVSLTGLKDYLNRLKNKISNILNLDMMQVKMSRLIDDINSLEPYFQYMHDEVETLEEKINSLGLTNELSLADLNRHLKDLDSYLHELLDHVSHIRLEIEPYLNIVGL